ncbi:hypothetical protein A3I99_00850 [Candidatus Kaiserbacteria bacterium RIFCSPLOWO2_02_FULL_45_11b]|uniref:Peptidase n=1 Tax=Candidatus Kaiserbacteria bacterium RIFCSPLOWO2_12_FULL_45_26 TaxID=1798525 RepID=A0A1F6FG45_9BACT|nr:MAG: hypothetical protein A2929_00225 [Candidatus Kaiserbacteria bacterium RIFCSPLOWO2_01_FULL_45_25]OGG84315.1 MAG: hypothetical protein A3I99_00850 [Candidatus Kaiserbacteria bacterium RIFCSPLOWO2_02_FULL_45_11b]OGG84829.1 MAG: hypothetical protein A3G90_01985 [Candidatus Kaiserbacteria bacterium RIFCSPLOWO2_12_FULL_45_26]
MTKYILHGGFTKIDNDSNRTFFRELVLDVPDGGSILMVHFASRNENPMQDFDIMKSKIRAEAANKNLNFVYATKEDFVTQIKAADAVYISGGSTNKLLEVLRSYEVLQPLLEGKTVAGSSAGAYAIAKLGASHSEDVMREGMGWAPLRVICHYESSELPPAPGAVQLLLQSSLDLELVILRDCECKVFRF